MRVLHVVESLDRGGLERAVCDLSVEQKRSGLVPAVFCLFHGGAFETDLVSHGIRVISGGKRPGLDLALLRRLRAVATGRDYDVIHTHNPVANYYAAMARLASWQRPPLVNTRHNMGARDPRDRREKLFRLSVSVTDRVVMVSEKVARKFVGEGRVPADKARVQINGLPLARYSPRTHENRSRARQVLGIPDSCYLVGTVGRLVSVKNQHVLIRALAVLRSSTGDLRLALIGEGPLAAELRQLAGELGVQDSVVFFGERADVPQILPALDCFVLPSLSEGHSIALLEAAATALPIVATEVGGNPEIVQDGRTGMLVPVGDVDATVAAIRSLAQDVANATELGAAARAWIEQHASISVMERGYEAIYRDAGA